MVGNLKATGGRNSYSIIQSKLFYEISRKIFKWFPVRNIYILLKVTH